MSKAPHEWSRRKLQEYIRLKRAGAGDEKQLTMYDREAPIPGVPDCCAFPDWKEEETFVVKGPLGPDSRHRGRRFTEWEGAIRFYAEKYGELPVQVYLGTSDWRRSWEGSVYAFRFHRRVIK